MDVTSSDLAGVYKEVAETVGVDNAYKIYNHFKKFTIRQIVQKRVD